MRGKEIVTLIMLLWAASASARSHEDIEKILKFTGYETEEELSESEVERFQDWLDRPIRINTTGIGRLRSCGLFSPFQAASLIDYRTRHGDIMSLNELSSIDGFTKEKVAVLAPFISLEGGSPAYGGNVRGFCDVTIKGGIRQDGASYGFKIKGGTGSSFTYGLGVSRPHSAGSALPESFSGYIGWESSSVPLRLIAGNFNLRFGQGLTLWNGMSMGGLSKPSSFHKSGTGLSSSYSFTGSSSFKGIAGEYSISRWRLTSAIIIPDIAPEELSVLPAFNLGWFGRNMTMSATHYMEFERSARGTHIPDMKTSADVAACVDGTDIFCEIAFDWASAKAAALGGCTFPTWEDTRMAVHLRYYPASYTPTYSSAARSGSRCSNELGASYSMEIAQGSGIHGGSLSLDAAYFPESKGDVAHSAQLKGSADWTLQPTDKILIKLRVSERFRTWEASRFKTDIRADFSWTWDRFCISSRLNIVRHVKTGFLGYVEGGYKREKVSVYLKGGIYLIDEWADRIYSYERSGPGNFSVPAFHGRGIWASLYSSWKFTSWGKAYVIGTVKPGKAELKLQLILSF